jgi:DNA polymerase I-like protein with 3'-5' exonuclease and polymerase domains
MAIKKTLNTSVVSRQIEEDIHVPFHVIGTPEWINESIGEGAVSASDITRVYSSKDLYIPTAWLKAQKELGVDSETGGDNKRDGLDPLSGSSRMLLFQLGTPEMVYLIEPKLVPEFKEILENQDKLFITQNGVYDFKFVLAKYSVHFINYKYQAKKKVYTPCLYDTMLAEQLITAGLYGVQVGLEELAEKYPPHRLISKAVRREFIDMRGVLEYRHLYYAARDVYLLFDIKAGQLLEAAKHKGMWERMQTEFCAMPGTADAELTGFDLDEVRIGYTLEHWVAKAKDIRAKVNKIGNEELVKKGLKPNFVLPDCNVEFDLDSSSKKLAMLKMLGFDVKNTKRETLLALDSPIGQLLGDYSECTKIISTYGERMLKRRSKTDGRLHPEFNQLGSGDIEKRKGGDKATTIATGRWSSDAQQFPRPDHIYTPCDKADASLAISLFSQKYNEVLADLTKPKETPGGTTQQSVTNDQVPAK